MGLPPNYGDGEVYALHSGEHVVTDPKARRWRKARFTDLGFSFDDAELLSRLVAADFHDIARWLEKGCTHDQATAIVAPVDVLAPSADGENCPANISTSPLEEN